MDIIFKKIHKEGCMTMEMNKKYFINELKKKLNYTEEQAIIINDILEDTFFIVRAVSYSKIGPEKILPIFRNSFE